MRDEATKRWMEERLGHLKQLRDEIRLDLHLAGMEAKERWQRDLEPQLREAERLVDKASENARKRMSEIVERFSLFRDGLREERSQHGHP